MEPFFPGATVYICVDARDCTKVTYSHRCYMWKKSYRALVDPKLVEQLELGT